jgi:hypothetical protein
MRRSRMPASMRRSSSVVPGVPGSPVSCDVIRLRRDRGRAMDVGNFARMAQSLEPSSGVRLRGAWARIASGVFSSTRCPRSSVRLATTSRAGDVPGCGEAVGAMLQELSEWSAGAAAIRGSACYVGEARRRENIAWPNETPRRSKPGLAAESPTPGSPGRFASFCRDSCWSAAVAAADVDRRLIADPRGPSGRSTGVLVAMST